VKKFILVITLLLKACAPQLMLQPAPSAPGTELSKAPSDKVMPVLWISSAVPDALRQAVLKWGFSVVPDSSYSNLRLDVDNEPLWGDDQ